LETEEDESPVTDFKRMVMRKFNELEEELKEIMQKPLNEYQENMEKKKNSRRHTNN
jgi:molybdenum-dependent DNA-binding transcriptional regulator ModE